MNANKQVEELLRKLPLAPAGVEKWVRREVVSNTYIIYSKKENKAVCTRCGRKFKMKHFPDAAHNAACICPNCKAEAKFKAAGMGRKKLAEQFRILILTHRGKTVYGTLFEIDMDFTAFEVPTLYTWLSALYVLTEKEQRYFKHHPQDYYGGEYWTEPKTFKLPHPPTGYNWGSWSKYERTEIYKENLEAVFTKSCLKYLWQPEFFKEEHFNAYDYISYMQQGLKYRSIELLLKAGFRQLVLNRIAGMTTRSINWQGKDLKKILRLPKRWHKKVREQDMGFRELTFFQKLTEQEKAVPWQVIEAAMRDGYLQDEIISYVPFIQAVEYMKEVQDTETGYMSLSDYRDYLAACEKNGEDMRRKEILFPDNFEWAHDRAIQKYEQQRDEHLNELIRKQGEKITGMKEPYHAGGLLIRPAASQTELNRESQKLNHCVKTYGSQMADGRCAILFIRQKADVDRPYYTLEISPNREFRQCRGDHNCGMTEEVKAFVHKWLQSIQKKTKKNKQEAA
ncbi:PcfJ domain-containing protein [Anaerovorax odorimutans]|nr:PcfJ domain-containing protein [Anaerovorax odorimutans]